MGAFATRLAALQPRYDQADQVGPFRGQAAAAYVAYLEARIDALTAVLVKLEEPDRVLDLAQAARLLKVSPRTTLSYVHGAGLKAAPLVDGRRALRFKRSDVLRWLDQRPRRRSRSTPPQPRAPGGRFAPGGVPRASKKPGKPSALRG